MRDKLGLVIVENKDGIAIQVFSDPDIGGSWFKEMSGKLTDDPWRATFVDLRFDPEFKITGETKVLPEKPQPPAFGWRLGEGPIPEPVKTEGKGDGQNQDDGKTV
jgi:hypothetical protein